jgi:hypothetical protein
MDKATERPTTIPTRRALLAGAPVAAAAALAGGTVANAVAIGMAKAGEVDPIFAVIAEHREAQEACAVAYEANDLDDDEDPNKLAALEKAGAVELPLFTTLPTSVAGVVALLEYVHSPCHIIWQGEQRGCDDTVLSYAYGYNSEEMRQAVGGFDAHVLTALRNIIERGQA